MAMINEPYLTVEEVLPKIPSFTRKEWNKCVMSKRFIPVLFEWYKFSAIICTAMGSIQIQSPSIRKTSVLYYAILSGLMNRCSKLMFSVMCLAKENQYGETIKLLGRSITESAVILQWLCVKDNPEYFKRYLADSMKKDLFLKDEIDKSVKERGNKMLQIEKTMLISIEKFIASTKLTEIEIRQSKSLPDFWSMCRDLKLSSKFYIGTYRMGSHEVHGTWTSLKTHYLTQDDDGNYSLRYDRVEPDDNHFMVIPLIILETSERFITYVVPNPDDRKTIDLLIKTAMDDLQKAIKRVVKSDFQILDQ